MRKKSSSQARNKEFKREQHHTKLAISLVIVAAFLAGMLIGIFAFRRSVTESSSFQEVRQGKYVFINPLLECEHAEDSIREKALQPFKHLIEERIASLTKEKRITSASVYYRDLNVGPSFGINEKEGYIPASLLKVVTMIAVLRTAESDKGVLQRKLLFSSPDTTFRQNIPAARSMVQGSEYTIDDLLYRLVAYSDNNAMLVLTRFAGAGRILQVYRDLGVHSPEKGENSELSVKEYASFFRILFNASYLSRPMSEKALSYLARSEFKTGIVAGVPSSLTVAHKFGEREVRQPDGAMIRQLHDCGIVYYPDHPYLLCIMTRGASFDSLSGAIQDISQTIHAELTRQYQGTTFLPLSK